MIKTSGTLLHSVLILESFRVVLARQTRVPALSSNTLHRILNSCFFSSPIPVSWIEPIVLDGNISLIGIDKATYSASIVLGAIPSWR